MQKIAKYERVGTGLNRVFYNAAATPLFTRTQLIAVFIFVREITFITSVPIHSRTACGVGLHTCVSSLATISRCVGEVYSEAL